jgi:hypothetical protein
MLRIVIHNKKIFDTIFKLLISTIVLNQTTTVQQNLLDTRYI